MIILRTEEGAEKCAFLDFLRDELMPTSKKRRSGIFGRETRVGAEAEEMEEREGDREGKRDYFGGSSFLRGDGERKKKRCKGTTKKHIASSLILLVR